MDLPPERTTIQRDSVCEKVGRVLIIVGGNLLVLVLGPAIRGTKEPSGSRAWWAAVGAATFHSETTAPIAWPLLAVFLLGNVLNLFGLWPEIRRSRYTIGGLMAAVVLLAVLCACLRSWPLVGLVLILMAALSPAGIIKLARPRKSDSGAVPGRSSMDR